jgi:hypothetical protein
MQAVHLSAPNRPVSDVTIMQLDCLVVGVDHWHTKASHDINTEQVIAPFQSQRQFQGAASSVVYMHHSVSMYFAKGIVLAACMLVMCGNDCC